MGKALAHLLVVDDNADNRDLFARRFERLGYAVAKAENGVDALQMMKRKEFDLIVLDVMMPGMSGLEVLREIRLRRSKVELPVLIATARSDSSEVVKALELGANDYVTKPLDFPVIKARIESHLRLRSEVDSIVSPPAWFLADGTASPGTIIDGRYEVLATLGRGGFAVVFKAVQLSTGQICAVKVMRPHRMAERANAEIEIARFRQEMDLIRRLEHPHIVRLIDSGTLQIRIAQQGNAKILVAGQPSIPPTQSGGIARSESDPKPSLPSTPLEPAQYAVPYIVMEFLDGRPVSDVIANESPMSANRAVEILLPVLSAVSVAHRAGVVHRDLKPPNIILTHRQGRPHPKVLDFGIAKLVDDEASTITTDEQFLGTPEYMSPEQASGSHRLSAQSDQYTLGVMLY
ncbi:MAG: response regulator, partial [Polyangiales bacterium]